MGNDEIKFVFDVHKMMMERRVLLVYEGEFTQEITKSVLAMAERNLEFMGEEENVKRKVFNVMVECLQNICKHTTDVEIKTNTENESAIFMIGLENNEYMVMSGNVIANDVVPGLRDRLIQINSLDKDGLKALYKEIIKGGSLSDKGGAGLGFVDMARKSGNKLDFHFEQLDSSLYSFFCLKTKISRERA